MNKLISPTSKEFKDLSAALLEHMGGESTFEILKYSPNTGIDVLIFAIIYPVFCHGRIFADGDNFLTKAGKAGVDNSSYKFLVSKCKELYRKHGSDLNAWSTDIANKNTEIILNNLD